MLQQLGTLTGYSSKKIDRARRLITLSVLGFLVLCFTTVAAGFLIHTEIMMNYQEHYQRMLAEGFTDLMIAPQVLSERILILVVMAPALGALVLMPMMIMAIRELTKLVEEKNRLIAKSGDLVDKHIARCVDVAQGRTDEVSSQTAA